MHRLVHRLERDRQRSLRHPAGRQDRQFGRSQCSLNKLRKAPRGVRVDRLRPDPDDPEAGDHSAACFSFARRSAARREGGQNVMLARCQWMWLSHVFGRSGSGRRDEHAVLPPEKRRHDNP